MKNKIFTLMFLFFFLACSSEDSEIGITEDPIKNDFYYSSIDFGNGRRCFRVTKRNNLVKKEIL